MLKRIYKIVKSVVFSAFILYGYNIIAAPLDLIIPINWITVCLVAILGIPGIFGLVILKLFVF
ncbi:MAG: pro-sigmaK processing inhibitor BofA family protein [Bacilli bacterium]|jgi:inhibitor of the pro-sigma K processing machinery